MFSVTVCIMEPRTVITVAIIAVIIIVAYVLLSGHGSSSKSTTTATGGEINGTTSMTVPPYITTYNALASKNFTNITGVDVKVQYTGPAVVNGVTCLGTSKAYTLNERTRLNAFANFTFYFYISTSNCNYTITNIGIDNNGFKLVYSQPPLPYTMPAESQIQESIFAKAPGYNFTGPLSITVYAK